MTSEVQPQKDTRYSPWLALTVVALGYFMNVLDSTAVNVAIPSIVSGLDASTEQILWVLNGYLFPFAMLLLLGGRLGDVLGHRNVFFAGLLAFTIASLMCALATSPEALIVGRVLQGIAAAAAAPQALAITAAVFPPQQRAMAFGVLASIIGSAAAAAPILGGALTSAFGWRSIFYLNLPIGLVGLFAAFIVLPATRDRTGRRLPIVASAVVSVGLFAVLFALIEGSRYDWGHIAGGLQITHLLIFGVVVLIAFVLWERAKRDGLLPVAIFTSRNYGLMIWASIATYFGIFGSQLVMTIYLQAALGVSPLQAGLVLCPMWVAASLVAPLAGRLSQKFQPKSLLVAGFAIFAVGTGLTAVLAGTGSSWGIFILPLIVAGGGAGLTFAPLSMVAMQEVSFDAVGGASGLIEVVRQVGAAICIASVGAILQVVWAAQTRSSATSAAAGASPDVRAQVSSEVERLVDRGLNAGSGGDSGVVAGEAGRILTDASTHSLMSAARPALFVTTAVIVLASVVSIFVRPTAARPVSVPDAESELQEAH